MNVLVIAPHPDDEVLGVGGTIARHASRGDRVFVCVVTSCYQPHDREDLPSYSEDEITQRRAETLEAGQILGVAEFQFCELPNNTLDQLPHMTLNRHIDRCLGRFNPEVVYVPHRGDVHIAHRLIYEACLVAVRPVPETSVRRVLAYEVPSSTEWGGALLGHPFTPIVYVDMEDHLERKLMALKAYCSEARDYPHARSPEAVRLHALKRGSEVGLRAAEAFMMIRELC